MRRVEWSRCLGLTVVTLVLSVAWGCAKTQVDSIQEYGGKAPLPRPDRVLVRDFAVSPKDVSPNSAVGARLAHALKGESATEEQTRIGREVAKTFTEALVKEIQSLGLPAEPGSDKTMTAANTVTVEGQFLSIDEGNRARRMVIGFGVGGTQVRIHTQVYQGTDSQRQIIQEFETTADSSKKPGMGPMAGVGAAATGAAATAGAVSGSVGVLTERDQTVQGDARRAARETAKALSRFFAGQGWIPADRVIK